MSTRTTVTLDDDVLERVKAESRARGLTFRETLNDLLRRVLAPRASKAPGPEFRVRATHMGYRPGLNCDCTEALLEYGEGERHR